LWLSHGSICLGEECEKIRSRCLSSCSLKDAQALGELLDPFLRLSLVRQQRPAAQYSTECLPLRKSLFRGKAYGGVGALLGSTPLTAELMEYGSQAQGISQAIEIRTLLCQGQHLIVPCQSLVRRAQVPQRPGR